VHADFMDVDLPPSRRTRAGVKVVGNIPYNITTPIIFRLLERDVRPRCIVLMIQREVADRILAPPGQTACMAHCPLACAPWRAWSGCSTWLAARSGPCRAWTRRSSASRRSCRRRWTPMRSTTCAS
jgi:hypothetical protein